MSIQTYRDLAVWQKAMDMVVAVYRLSGSLPHHEQFGLTNQLRRAAVSVPANISEGYGRFRRGDFLRFLSISKGSLCEVETHLQIALRLGYITDIELEPVWAGLQELGRLLNGLIRSLESKEWQSKDNSRTAEVAELYETDSRLLTPDS